MNKIKQKACVSFLEQKHKHHFESEKIFFLFFLPHALVFVIRSFFIKKLSPSFECETFLHVLHGKQHDKQVQGGSVLIIEPGTLCVSQKPKSIV